MSLRIAYIGPEQGTSLHRARALERLGHHVTIIDPWAWLGNSKWVGRWLHHAGGAGVGIIINRRILNAVTQTRPDLIWINQGEFLGKSLINNLKCFRLPIVNYINDDPFNPQNAIRFRSYIKALPYYDLIAVVREQNVTELKTVGARRVIKVWMSADEVAHQSRILPGEVGVDYASDVLFIGTWMPERGPFIAELIERGVPITILGNRWEKAREWSIIKPYWRGVGIYDDAKYAAAIQSARICLGLLSKGNRDLHTTRSLEIPALGGVLCAERTQEHEALYDDEIEAVFFSDAEECADICHQLLVDEQRRMEIARRGHERALRNNLFNEPVMASIIEAAQNI